MPGRGRRCRRARIELLEGVDAALFGASHFQAGQDRLTRQLAPALQGKGLDHANIDAMTMWLLKNPFNYDVLVAPNLYGDIISDLCAQMVGGLGFGCSGNIGAKLAVFEPTHGSAPKATNWS